MLRTITVKLEDNQAVTNTVRCFNECCNFFRRVGFDSKTYSKWVLQALGYREARRRWPCLQSSLVQGARDCACDMLRHEELRGLPFKKPWSSARFNQRTFKAYLDSACLSLATVNGRQRIPIRIPEYFLVYSGGGIVSLRIRLSKGALCADLVIELPAAAIPNKVRNGPPVVLGVDRGITNAAVSSNGAFFNSRAIRRVRGRYAYLRGRLQAAGTRSARRHLRRLSGRERRFQADTNHCIAKQIAAMDYDVLALEELGIRRRKPQGPRFNRMLGGWAYAKLGAFLKYKCEDKGKRVVLVPPENTSRTCSRCGAFGRRHGSTFSCPSCGIVLNADLNAARNIA
ncbi:MAG: RNA-guided endonuclease TnpB family protein [Promethearchaeati archaeon SRVP18_Atabeyarchaeia-1]